MDSSEKLVAKYLRHCGFSHIVYEPDGNVPPDFLADNNVAVEVRCLNQNYDDGRKTRGLEEASISLWRNIKELAESIQCPRITKSYYVFVRFMRPLEEWKHLKRPMQKSLQALMTRSPNRKTRIIVDNLQLDIWPASKPMRTFFVMAGQSEEQSGGWVVEEMGRNLKHCIEEKTRRVALYKAKYREWWLVLPDLIGYGLDAFDQERLQEQLSLKHEWDRIVLLDPADPCRAFVL